MEISFSKNSLRQKKKPELFDSERVAIQASFALD